MRGADEGGDKKTTHAKASLYWTGHAVPHVASRFLSGCVQAGSNLDDQREQGVVCRGKGATHIEIQT